MDAEHDQNRAPRRSVGAWIALGLAAGCGGSLPPAPIVPPEVLDVVPRQSTTPTLVIGLLANANGAFDSSLGRPGADFEALAGQLAADGLTRPDALLLDNGDVWTHAPVVRLEGPEPVLRTYAALGVDALNLGHHDYEPGPSRLTAWAEDLGTRFLGANVWTADGARPPFLQPSLRTSRSGVAVCVLGLNSVDTAARTRAGASEGLRFEPYAPSLERELRAAWRAGCELTIALVHDEPAVVAAIVAGLPPDLPLDLAVAADDGGFSVRRIRDTTIVHPGAYGRQYAIVEVRLGRTTPWHLRVVDRRVNPAADPAPVDEALAPWRAARARARLRLAAEVGRLPDLLRPGTFGASDLGHFVCDAWLAQFADADVALLNFGALRAALPAGSVRERDLLAALPFDDELVRIEVTGRELASLLTHGAPVVGGFTWSYRRRDGQRMIETILGPDGAPVGPDDRLRLVTVDFLAGGGDGVPFAGLTGALKRTGVDWRAPVRARLASSTGGSLRTEARARELQWAGAAESD